MEKIPRELLVKDLLNRLEIQKNINETHIKKLNFANRRIKTLTHEVNQLKSILHSVHSRLDKQLNKEEIVDNIK